MENYRYTVIIEPDEEGGYSASCPALEGCVSQGDTYDEALENIREAIAAYIESLKKHNEPIPGDVDVKVQSVQVAA
ncbi:MAG TPA: type II toxin-antitoxin system HicB family antitoxin [Nitrospirota bacterium]|jgi:predicted RNase H-like HicB family nuclease